LDSKLKEKNMSVAEKTVFVCWNAFL
jgi:hypothetical protein